MGAGETWAEAWADLRAGIEDGAVLLAEDEGGLAGYVEMRAAERGVAHLETVYVRPDARRRGVAKSLVREAVAVVRGQGAEHVTLEVVSSNSVARSVWERLGFAEVAKTLAQPLPALEARLGVQVRGESFGSVHVQTDDASAVDRAVRQFLPRVGGSAESAVSEPRNGWVAVYTAAGDRDPSLLRRLARELSDRMGAVVVALGVEDGAVVRYVLFDRGTVADEYASVPEYHGPLPPGDVVALRANPTVAARLTGADPARVRQVARTGASPAELPPARELLAAIAGALGLAGADRGYSPG